MPDPNGPLAELILCRLLVPAAKKLPAPSAVLKDVAKLFRDPPTRAEFDAVLEGLRSAGLVDAKEQQLTDAGRARALAHLGVTALPARCPWGTIQSKYLVPKALGLTPGSKDSLKRITGKGKLAARVVKRGRELPAGTGDSLKDVVEALACRALGFPKAAKLSEVHDAIAGRELEALTGSAATKNDALRRGVLRAAYSPAAPPAALDLETFAARVRAAAEACPTGRFGDNKVFISHVWRHLQGDAAVRGLGLDGFKDRLVEANVARLLTLNRADSVQLMDAKDVRESETAYLNAVFHFILLEGTD